MACIITYNGKNFTEKQFKNLLKSGLLYESLQRGLVSLPVDTAGVSKPEKQLALFKRNFVYNKEDLFATMKGIFGLKDAEARANVFIFDRMANAWAARNNRPVEDYYKTVTFIKADNKNILKNKKALFSGLNEFSFTNLMEFEDDLDRSAFTVNKDGKEIGSVEINKNNNGNYYISWLSRTSGNIGDGSKIFKAVTQNLINQGVNVDIDTAITSGGFKMLQKLADEGFLIKTGEEITEPNQKDRKPMIYAQPPFIVNTDIVKPNDSPLLFQQGRTQALNAVIKGFNLTSDPKAFTGAFRTKNGKATRELASRINLWMENQGLYGIKFYYEPTYGTINAIPTTPVNNRLLFQSPTINSIIRSTDDLKTFDLTPLEGKKQTDQRNDEVSNNIINHPDSPMVEGGETFRAAYNRVTNYVKNVVDNGRDNSVIVTHNTVFGLIKLLNEKGFWNNNREDFLNDKAFREEYTTRDSTPADSFQIKTNDGRTINVVRHGETEDNVAGNFRSAETKLTENGIKAAQELNKQYGSTEEIHSSSLPRAIHTANLLKNGDRQTLVDRARELSDNVKGIYSLVFRDNTEQALYEAAVQANSSEGERQGAIKTFGKEIVDIAQELFPNVTAENNIYSQGAQGAILIGQDMQDIIYALKSPNVSTPLHEFAHRWERELTAEERKQVLDWAGTTEWSRETSEKWARGFEKFLTEGQSESPTLTKLFNQFKKWLTDIYKGIVGSDIDLQLNDDMRALYSTMLGENFVSEIKQEVAQEKELQSVDPAQTIDPEHDWKTPISEEDTNKEFKKDIVKQAYDNKSFDLALQNNEITVDQLEEIVKAAGLPSNTVDKVLFRMTNPETVYNVEGLSTMKTNAVFQQIANYFLENGQIENAVKNEVLSLQDAKDLLDRIESEDNTKKLEELKKYVSSELLKIEKERENIDSLVKKERQEEQEADIAKKGGFSLGESVLFQNNKFRIIDTLEDNKGRFLEFILAEETSNRNATATPEQLIKWNEDYEKEWQVNKKIESLKKELGSTPVKVNTELKTDNENPNLQFVTFKDVSDKGIDAQSYNSILSIARKFSAMFPLLKMQVVYSDDNLKGHISNGIAVINLKNATQDTPIHEVMHPFVLILQQSKPEFYSNLLNEFRGLANIYNVYKDEVKANTNYQFLTEAQIEEEAFVQYLGERISDLHDAEGNFIDPIVYANPESVIKFTVKKQESSAVKSTEVLTVTSNGQELGVLKIKTVDNVTTILDSTVNEDSFTQEIYDKLKKRTGAETLQSTTDKISNNKLEELESGNFEVDERDTQEYFEARGYKKVGVVTTNPTQTGQTFSKVKMVHPKSSSIVGTFFGKFYKWFVDLLKSVIPKSKVGRKAVEFSQINSAIYDPKTEKVSFYKPATNKGTEVKTVEVNGELKKVDKINRDTASFTVSVDNLKEDLFNRGASEEEISDIVNQVNSHFDPSAKLKIDLSKSYVANTGNLESVNNASSLSFNFFSSPSPVVDIKDLPADLSIDNLATLLSYAGNKIRFDLAPYQDALTELEAFQYTQADAAKDLIKHTEKRLALLQAQHDRIGLEQSSTVKNQYFKLKELLSKSKDIEFIDGYIRQGISAIDSASRIIKYVQDNIKLGESQDEQKNQILQRDIREAQALISFYDNIPNVLDRNHRLFEQEDLDTFNYTLAKAARTKGDINTIIVDLTADWLFPTLENSQKKIQEENRLSKEQFKQNIRSATQDVDFPGYWLSAVANSKDPLTAALGIKIKDDLNKNYEEEAHSLQRLRILFDKFLKDTGIPNKVEAIEKYYKENFLRKAKVWELINIDNEGVKHYGYVDRWAFNEEYLSDLHSDDRRKEIERLTQQLGEPNNYQEREIFNKRLNQWDEANPLKSEKYKNPTFQKLKNNEYYMFLYNMYKESNGKYEDKKLKYGIIPQSYNGGSFLDKVKSGFASAKDIIRLEGVSPLQKAKELAVTAANSVFDRHSFEKIQSLNLDNTYYMSVKAPYIRLIDEKDLSFKLNEAVYGFHTSANQYRILKSNQANIENLKLILNGNIDLGIKARKVLKTKIRTRDGKTSGELVWDRIKGLPPQDKEQSAKRLTKQINAFINDVFYGVPEETKEFNVGPVIINVNKLADSLGFLTATLNMSFNLIAGVSNVAIGNVMSLGEAIGSKYYKPEHWLKAQKTYGAALATSKFFADSIDPVKSKITQLGIIFDAIQGEFRDKYGKAITGNILQKYFTKDSLFILSHMGEHQIQLTGMLALMYGTEVTLNDGTKTNLYDAYVKDEKGFYKIREDAKWSENDKLSFIKTLHGLSRDLNGNYAAYDKSMLQRYSLGKLVLQYRKYFYTAWRSRIGAKRFDYERGTTQEGYYRAFITNLVNDIREYNTGALKRNFFDPIFNKENISKEQGYAARKTLYDISMIAGMTLLAGMLANAEVGNPDDDDKWFRQIALLWALRLRSDVSSYSLTAPQEVSRMISNPSASFNTIKQFADFLGQASTDLSNGQFETYDKRSGSHQAGDYKLMSKFEKLIPGYRQWLRLQTPGEQLKYYDLINKNVK